MLISDWSSDVCSSDLTALDCFASLAMTKNVLDERPALLRRLHIHRCLHTLVERLARRTDALGVGRGRPVAVRRDHQLALRIDEDALPEAALRAEDRKSPRLNSSH